MVDEYICDGCNASSIGLNDKIPTKTKIHTKIHQVFFAKYWKKNPTLIAYLKKS